MEIVMQWLDDLEDLFFALLSAWRGVCRLGLSLGFLASLLVIAAVDASTLLTLTAVALASVLAWFVAVVSTVVRSNRLHATSA